MKKTKKFDDGGPTGGHYVDMGDSRNFVADVPADVPVAATMGPIPSGMGPDTGRPVGAGMGAGLAGQGAGYAELLAADRPDVVARPMGLMMPRGRGLGGSLAGQLAASRTMKKGGTVKKMAKGGSVSSASKRADGCAVKGKTKGRII